MKRTLTTVLIVAIALGTLAGFAGSATAQEGIEQTVNQDASNTAEQTGEVTNGTMIQTIDQDASNMGVQTAESEGDSPVQQMIDQDASNMGTQSMTVTDGETGEQTINQDASNAAEQSG